jgi:hypothetical protein
VCMYVRPPNIAILQYILHLVVPPVHKAVAIRKHSNPLII